MMGQRKRIICMLLTLAIAVASFMNPVHEVQVQAAQSQSIYNYVDAVKPIYGTIKIVKSGTVYYAQYQWQGKTYKKKMPSKNMTFEDFGKKLGFKKFEVKSTTKEKTIKKSSYELKKLSASALVAFICKDIKWVFGFGASVATDKVLGKLLKSPGTYKFTSQRAEIEVEYWKGATEKHTVMIESKVQKKVDGKWKTITNATKPIYW